MASSTPSIGGSLADLFPALAAEWHPTRNGELSPSQVKPGSDKKVWWLGPCGHEWAVSVVERTARASGCSYCRGKSTLPGFNDLATLRPDVAAEWHSERNGDLTASSVRPFSSKKVWWLGPCGHEWQATVAKRTDGRLCPYCSNKRLLIGFNDLATTHPDLATEWHPTRNGGLTPSQVVAGSLRKVWWLAHGHEWSMSVLHRAVSGQGCAVCRGLQIQVGANDLASSHPDIAERWHPELNSPTTPRDVTAGSSKAWWWLGTCGHTFRSDVKHMAKGGGCAVCRGLQIEVGSNDLASQYPDVATEWHPTRNGRLLPSQVSSSSGRRVWWRCSKGHEWQVSVAGRKYGQVGCPSCAIGGFDPNLDGWLYLLEHTVWDAQQIGITNRPEFRISQHATLGWQVVEVRGPMPGSHARMIEQDGLAALRRRGAILGQRGARGFDGHTESWPSSSLRLASLRELVGWIHADDDERGPLDLTDTYWTRPLRSRDRDKPKAARALCAVEGCDRTVHGMQLCRMHYRRWRASGDAGPAEPLRKPAGFNATAACSVAGCTRAVQARGMCSMHYTRWRTSGDPGEVSSRTDVERPKVCVVDGCDRACTTKAMCDLHYRRWRRFGDPTVARKQRGPRLTCTVDGCDALRFGHGLCNKHYKRWRKSEDASLP